MSDFEKVLITWGLDTRMILLKIWVDCNAFLTTSAVIRIFMFSIWYGIPKILRYNLDCGNLGNMISFKLTTSIFLMYFSIILRSKVEVTLFIIIVRPLLSAQIKSAIMSDLMSLSALLILVL